tara:strand:+ start:20 stop:559 length:540 start_codon:yes stop_codon:yes gene_type:complete
MEYTFYKLSIADKCYVGSTTDFDKRMRNHKSNCNNKNNKRHNSKVYQYMRQNGGWENVKVMIIDKIIYNHKREAEEMETTFMLRDGAELNSQYPKRSIKEWYVDNREIILERDKQKFKDNKQQILERCKEYYEKNRKKINERNREKITCDICSKIMSRDWMTRHKKLHCKFIDENIHPF